MRARDWSKLQHMVVLSTLVIVSGAPTDTSMGQASRPSTDDGSTSSETQESEHAQDLFEKPDEWIAWQPKPSIELRFRSDWVQERIHGGLLLRTDDSKGTEINVHIRADRRLEATEVYYADDGKKYSARAKLVRANAFYGRDPIVYRSRNLLRIDLSDQIIFGSQLSDGKRNTLITVRLPKDAPAQTIRDARHILAATDAGPAPIDPEMVGIWASPTPRRSRRGVHYVIFRPDGSYYDLKTHARYTPSQLEEQVPNEIRSAVEWKLRVSSNPKAKPAGGRRGGLAQLAAEFWDIQAGQWRHVDSQLSMQITCTDFEEFDQEVEIVEGGNGLIYQNRKYHRIGSDKSNDYAGN